MHYSIVFIASYSETRQIRKRLIGYFSKFPVGVVTHAAHREKHG